MDVPFFKQQVDVVPDSYGHVAHPSRLDQWLTSQMNQRGHGVSRSYVQELIGSQLVTVNGTLRKSNASLKPGDLVEARLAEPLPTNPTLNAARIPLEILFEDDSLLVLNKPQGLTVHPGAGTRQQTTLIEGVLAHVGRGMLDEFVQEDQPQKGALGPMDFLRPGIVHRLDRDTSGVMVVAKTRQAHQELSQQFRDKTKITRDYIALGYGVLQAPVVHESWLSRDPHYRVRYCSKPLMESGSRWSQSTFYPLAVFGNRLSLMQVSLKTGRTHQIRIHGRDLGVPLVGDRLYGGRQDFPAGNLSDLVAALPGQMLHAFRLGFVHPKTGNPLTFMAEYPAPFKQLVASLEAFRTA